MNWTNLRLGVAFALVLAGTACGLLDASDPTAIEDEELTNTTGADLLRRDALRRLYLAVTEGALASGMLADEFLADPPTFSVQSGRMTSDEMLDRRRSEDYEEHLVGTPTYGVYVYLQEARRAATIAVDRYRPYAAESGLRARLGEMFALRGFTTLKLAEDFCPGVPLHDVVNYRPVYRGSHSTDEAFEEAVADLDTAITYGADSARVLDFARVARARALLGLGRFADAGAAVASVPTDYLRNAEYAASSYFLRNRLDFSQSFNRRSVADRDGENGLDFVSAADARVETMLIGTANDGVTGIYAATKYPDAAAPIVLASGIEARLIEAEAGLRTGTGDWLSILNELRATRVSPSLPALADPGTEAERVDLLFRERAFWLFGTGHRLADLRRLVRHYGRDAEQVFPSGSYRIGGDYSTATSIPFPAALEARSDPSVTGCTRR